MNAQTHPGTKARPQDTLPVYRELVEFFERITAEKNQCKQELEQRLQPLKLEPDRLTVKMSNGFPLLEKDQLVLDIPSLKRYLHRLAPLASWKAPISTETIVQKLIPDNEHFERMIRAVLREEAIETVPGVLTFLITETIRPVLEVYAGRMRETISSSQWDYGYCPVCGAAPMLSLLKGEEGRRFLVCSSCATEWRFSRIKCPFCDNSDFKTLSYFVAGDEQRHRIEVCEECKHYIKTIDQRAASQEVSCTLENIQSLHLDILAQERGYQGCPSLFCLALDA